MALPQEFAILADTILRHESMVESLFIMTWRPSDANTLNAQSIMKAFIEHVERMNFQMERYAVSKSTREKNAIIKEIQSFIDYLQNGIVVMGHYIAEAKSRVEKGAV